MSQIHRRHLPKIVVAASCAVAVFGFACRSGPATESRTPGERAFRGQCSVCHRLPAKTMKSAAEWSLFLKGHARRAKLSEEQVGLLTAYLTAGE